MMETAEIFLGDYPKRLQDTARALSEALNAEDASEGATLAEGHPIAQLRAELEATKQEARDAKQCIEVKPLGRNAWRDLREKHPPRKAGDPGVTEDMANGDEAQGVNLLSVEDDLLFAAIVQPKFDSRAAYDEWLATDPATPGQWNTAVQEAWRLTHGRPFDPASLPASWTTSTG